MLAVIFEAIPAEGKWDDYLDTAAALRPALRNIPGFISVERFQSLTQPEKVLSLSFWEDEESVSQWRNAELHRQAQKVGRENIFCDYRIRVAAVARDYGMNKRMEAPADSARQELKDIEINLENIPGQLALMGETLGKNGISLEGGGVFQHGERAIAHFLVTDADKAKFVLDEVGIKVSKIHDVVIQKLRQGEPGQLGKFSRLLANAGVNILVQYSDHANQLIIVPDDYEKARKLSLEWQRNA